MGKMQNIGKIVQRNTQTYPGLTQQRFPCTQFRTFSSAPLISASEIIRNRVRSMNHAKHTNTDVKTVPDSNILSCLRKQHYSNKRVAQDDSSVVSCLRHHLQKRTHSFHQVSMKSIVNLTNEPEVANVKAGKIESLIFEKDYDYLPRITAFEKKTNSDFLCAWLRYFEYVRQFKVRYGNFDVSNLPRSDIRKNLASWMKKQREEYEKLKMGEKSQLTEERIATLQAIGFNWSTSPASTSPSWDDMYKCLCSHKKRYGPDWRQNIDNNALHLSKWFWNQRHEYHLKLHGKKTKLEHYQIRLLEDMFGDWYHQPFEKRIKDTTNTSEYDKFRSFIDAPVNTAEAEAKTTVVNDSKKFRRTRTTTTVNTMKCLVLGRTADGGSKPSTRTRTRTTVDTMESLVLGKRKRVHEFQQETKTAMIRNVKQKERKDQDEVTPETPASSTTDTILPPTVVVSLNSVEATSDTNMVDLSSSITIFEPDRNSDDHSNIKTERNDPCDKASDDVPNEVTDNCDGYESEGSDGTEYLVF